MKGDIEGEERGKYRSNAYIRKLGIGEVIKIRRIKGRKIANGDETKTRRNE